MPRAAKKRDREDASPAPRRARVAKACDNCKLRKSRCDGNSPCAGCTTHKFSCTYGDSRDRKVMNLGYILDLEATVADLRKRLGASASAPASEPVRPHMDSQTDSSMSRTPLPKDCQGVCSRPQASKVLLDTMATASEQVKIDPAKNFEYLGNFSGLTFIRIIQEHCSLLLGNFGDEGNHQPFKSVSLPFAQFGLDSDSIMLPAKDLALQTITSAFNLSFPLFRCVHRPFFMTRFDQLYAGTLDGGPLEKMRFQSLFFEMLALGEFFSSFKPGPEEFRVQQLQQAELFFRIGQKMIDVADCRNLTSLQAIVCMAVYLQSAGRTSACHSYISLAMAACIKMGLHRAATDDTLNEIEHEAEKRLFWITRNLETYVTTTLGLPMTLKEDDIDQEFPTDVEDESIHADGIKSVSLQRTSSMSAVNAHTKLLIIMAKVKQHVHSGTGVRLGKDGSYLVDYAHVIEVEKDLEQWLSELPPHDPSMGPVIPNYTCAQLLLRLAHGHVQMVLYRPFLCHLTRDKSSSGFDLRAFACGSACINAAMQVVGLGESLEAEGFLSGSLWLVVYATFHAVMILLMFALSKGNDPTAHDALSAAVKGFDTLKLLSHMSYTAKNCIDCLDPLFFKLSARGLSQSISESAALLSKSTSEKNGLYSRTYDFRPVDYPNTFDFAAATLLPNDSK